MIRSFKDKETQKLFMGRRSRAVSEQAVRRAQLKLAQLDQVDSVEELKIPPGNRLHALGGDREGQWAIRINDQYRICFRFRTKTRTRLRLPTIISRGEDMVDWTEEIEREERVYPPVHPGEVLREEWLIPLDINANQLAGALGVDRQKVYDIVNGKRGVSAEMALRLARWSGMRPRFWLGLQEQYDLAIVQMEAGQRIENEVRPLATSSTPRTPQDPR